MTAISHVSSKCIMSKGKHFCMHFGIKSRSSAAKLGCMRVFAEADLDPVT